MKSHTITKWSAIIYLWELMLLGGISFYRITDMPIFSTFAQHTGIYLNGTDFSIISFVGAFIVPFILLIDKKKVYLKRFLYVLCGLPLAAFTVPYAVYLLASGTFNLLIVVYINIYFSFLILAGAVFRLSE